MKTAARPQTTLIDAVRAEQVRLVYGDDGAGYLSTLAISLVLVVVLLLPLPLLPWFWKLLPALRESRRDWLAFWPGAIWLAAVSPLAPAPRRTHGR